MQTQTAFSRVRETHYKRFSLKVSRVAACLQGWHLVPTLPTMHNTHSRSGELQVCEAAASATHLWKHTGENKTQSKALMLPNTIASLLIIHTVHSVCTYIYFLLFSDMWSGFLPVCSYFPTQFGPLPIRLHAHISLLISNNIESLLLWNYTSNMPARLMKAHW